MEKRGHFGNINMMETRTLNMIGDEELQGGGGGLREQLGIDKVRNILHRI